jgi:thymidylate synthase
MHLEFRNVNDAFYAMVRGVVTGDVETEEVDSRNGPVLRVPEPVMVTYSHPRERVLFNEARDCNPFFHVYESLWMLAGRNDVAPLAYYVSRFREYSDDGKTLNGAYGHRWRYHQWDHEDTDTDQLDILVAHLKTNPNSRRAVLQMWNVEDDLLKIGGFGNRIRCTLCHGTGFWETEQLGTEDCPKCNRTGWIDEPASKDVCCNLSVMFSLRSKAMNDDMRSPPFGQTSSHLLDMTVYNRSNDMIWGMLGANYVHFTMLQEYMAARLDVDVGKYHHVTNDLHIYKNNWEPDEWLGWYDKIGYDGDDYVAYGPEGNAAAEFETVPLVKDPHVFEQELPRFVELHSSLGSFKTSGYVEWTEPFLRDVADPLLKAFHWRKMYQQGTEDLGEMEDAAQNIQDSAWRTAAMGWINKRVTNKKES